jgi:SAM-dependent methyltransferase
VRLPQSWIDALRCPATGSSLTLVGDYLEAGVGNHRYPIVDGVPIMLVGEPSLFELDGGAPAASRGRAGRLLDRWVPSGSRNVRAGEFIRLLRTLLVAGWEPGDPSRRVLVVGGATLGAGLGDGVLEHPALEVIATDVYIGPQTQLVCDGHDLPFQDNSFDAAICQAVLQYVLAPERVVSEIHRVLVPGGLVYSDVPFMQQVHGGPLDFTRFTLLGHRRLFRCFDEIRSGAVCGPAMALSWSIRYFGYALAGNSRMARAILDRAVRLVTFWLPYLDEFLARRPAGMDGASATGFLGRRRETPIPDSEIVASYRGATSSGYG